MAIAPVLTVLGKPCGSMASQPLVRAVIAGENPVGKGANGNGYAREAGPSLNNAQHYI